MAGTQARTLRRHSLLKQRDWHVMLLPGLLLLMIFSYLPMFGLVSAFQNYKPARGFFASEWVGLKHFENILNDRAFGEALVNTLGINLLNLIFGFPAPIIFALMLNELPFPRFKRTVQTISYLPYFISWVVYGGLILRMLATDGGLFNDVLKSMGLIENSILFMGNPDYFWAIAVISSITKGLGYGAIIYLAAISGVSADMIEAAILDGAGRLQRIVYIILPAISGTIVIFLILQVAGMLNSGFDQIWILQNNVNISASEVIDTYVYKVGMVSMRLSYASAVGLGKSIVSTVLLLLTNALCVRVSGKGLF